MLHRIRLALRAAHGRRWAARKVARWKSVRRSSAYKPRNMHKDRKLRIARAKTETPAELATTTRMGKTAIMGMFDRDSRQVRAKIVPDVKRETLQGAEILDNKSPTRLRDLHRSARPRIRPLREKYIHETVNHVDHYVRGQVHTNCLENFWSLMKRGLHGTYVAVEPFHPLATSDEQQVFRFNNRGTKENPLNDEGSFCAGSIAGFREETDLCRTDWQGGRNGEVLAAGLGRTDFGCGGRGEGRSALREPLAALPGGLRSASASSPLDTFQDVNYSLGETGWLPGVAGGVFMCTGIRHLPLWRDGTFLPLSMQYGAQSGNLSNQKVVDY